MTTPYTEQSNPLTANIDSLSPADIIHTLGEVDKQLFTGVPKSSSDNSDISLLGRDNIGALDALSDLIGYAIDQNLVKLQGFEEFQKYSKIAPDHFIAKKERIPFGVVFAGCGTSGRVAFLCARQFNRIFENELRSVAGSGACPQPMMTASMFRYIMAADDDALTLSIELPEDDPLAGVASLRKYEELFEHIIVVGITCGLSAPFVAGMLDYAQSRAKSIRKEDDWKPESKDEDEDEAEQTKTSYTAVLMGFNPVSMARNSAIEKWAASGDADAAEKTCLSVFQPLEAEWRKSGWQTMVELLGPMPQSKEKTTCGCCGGGAEKPPVRDERPLPMLSSFCPGCISITPVVGAEAITGSSRMKGGSATMMMLCAVGREAFGRAQKRRLPAAADGGGSPFAPPSSSSHQHQQQQQQEPIMSPALPATTSAAATTEQLIGHLPPPSSTLEHLNTFQAAVFSALYNDNDDSVVNCLGQFARDAANAIQQGGRVVYVGIDYGGSAGAIGMMDASEMVDTYGCRDDEWRALTAGGWKALRNQDGDRSNSSSSDNNNSLLSIEARDGGAEKWLRQGDLLIVLDLRSKKEVPAVAAAGCSSDSDIDEEINEELAARLCNETAERVGYSARRLTVWNSHEVFGAEAETATTTTTTTTTIVEPVAPHAATTDHCHIFVKNSPWMLHSQHSPNYFFDCCSELVLKLATNAISTTAQILRGAVFTNRMINVTVSNNKLFFRTLEMIKLFASCDEATALKALLSAIYRDGGRDNGEQEQASTRSVAEHVVAATPVKNVLPVATLLAAGAAATAAEALDLLAASGNLRSAMKSILEGTDKKKENDSGSSNNNEKSNEETKEDATPTLAERGGFIMRSGRWPDDRDGLYHVCLKTGDSGGDGEPFYQEDPDALGRVYCGPYLKHETRFAVVLEKQQTKQIAGYTLGALDTRDFFVNKYEKEWRPEIAAQFADPADPPAGAAKPKSAWSRSEQMHHVYHHPEFQTQLDCVDLEQYPSHLHIDLLEEARGCGLGRLLIEELLSRLKGAGSVGCHLMMAASNEKAFGFYQKLGFEQLCEDVGGHKFLGKKL